MTRPNIVRADTLDLQDQDNPSAAEHLKPKFQNGLAPHQRAEVHHVLEERHSEEQSLADAWNISDNIVEEPGAIEQAQQQDADAEANGEEHEDGDEEGAAGEVGESEVDGDDDMMDRISSSPSIDDGGLPFSSSPPAVCTPLQEWQKAKWPERKSSLSPSPPSTSTASSGTFNHSVSSSPSSSPFTLTPRHLPLGARAIEESSPTLTGLRRFSSNAPEGDREIPAPVETESMYGTFSHPVKRCHLGRYRPVPGQEPEYGRARRASEEDEGYDEPREDLTRALELQHKEVCNQDEEGHSKEELRRSHSFGWRPCDQTATPRPSALWEGSLPKTTSANSINSVNLEAVLLPTDDPLLDTPPSPTDSSGSWESLSSAGSDISDQDTTDDDIDVFFHDLDDRFIDSGWGGECLRDTEEIDFQFVYALHTFVATVEGQANATKGDTMVLLDDSNSYWWLVRVVKDSSIGYLPAEHIETPTERLARLNKHRNIDLSATMLSDNSEKAKNPFKKAIRRRNAKTVTFAAPTYVEASDYEYSDEEEEGAMVEPYAIVTPVEEPQQNGQAVEAEPKAELKPAPEDSVRTSTSSRNSFDREQAATLAAAAAASAAGTVDEPQRSPKLIDKTEAAPLKSRKGTPRNTDSFLRDENMETRKITLTPGLLREDSMSTKSLSSESTRNNSLDGLTKQSSPTDTLVQKAGKKEKKEKKPGMLSGLFKSKKKDKKLKEDADQSESEKPSMEMMRESPRGSPLPSGRNSPIQASPQYVSPVNDSRRPEVNARSPSQRSKLQKSPPSSGFGTSGLRDDSAVQTPSSQPTAEQRATPAFVAELQGSEAAHEMAVAESEPVINTSVSSSAYREGPFSPITNLLKPSDSQSDKPLKAKRSKQRVAMDDFDPADEVGPNPFKEQEDRARSSIDQQNDRGERLSDSPVEIAHNTFMHGTEIVHVPIPGMNEESEGEDDVDELVHEDEADEDDEQPESLTSSPSIIDHPSEPPELSHPSSTTTTTNKSTSEDNDPTPTGPRSPQPASAIHTASTATPLTDPRPSTDSHITTSSSSSHQISPASSVSQAASQQTWSDSSLRSWLDDGSDVRDMMTLIHDPSGVVPVSHDHPMMVGLFTEQKGKVEEMMGTLDGLLGTYLSRKGIALG